MGTLVGEQSQAKSAIRSRGGIPILDETYHYLVRASSVTEERLSVLATTGVPQVGFTTSASGLATCTNVEATRRPDQRLLWDITATFSSEVDERQTSTSLSQPPDLWVPIYETKMERMQEVTTKDADGDPIANSAGQPFDNGLMRSRFIPVWEFFQFEPDTVSDEDIIERNETVNEVEFKGRDPKTLLLTVLSSVVGFFYGSRVRFTRYALRYNEQNWTQKRLDVGTVYLDGTTQLPYIVAGQIVLGGLDGAGAKVAAGDPPEVLEFDVYRQVKFADFLRL